MPEPTSAPRPPSIWKIALALAIGLALYLVAGFDDLTSLRATVVGCAVIVSLVPFISNAIANALDRLRNPSPKTRTLIALGIGVLGGLYLFTTAAVLQGRTLVPKMEDECSYVIGAQLLARGHLWMAAHPLADFFEALFIIVKPFYCSIYFPGTSIFYAPMVWLHLPTYVMPLVVSGAVIAMLYRVVTEMMDGVAGLLACFWIIALSEFRTLSVMVMSHLPMLLLGLLMVWAWLRWRASRRVRWALVLGIFSGWAAITRPADAVIYALPIGIAMIAQLWKHPRRQALPAAAALLIGAAPFLALQVVFDKGVTGHALESPYTYSLKLDQPGTQFGFQHYDPDAAPPTKHIGKLGYYLWCQTFLKNHQFPQVLKRWVFSEGNNLGPHQSYFMIIVNNALPAHLLLILIPVGLLAMNDRRQLVLIATFFTFCVIYFFNPFFLEHYLMVVVPAAALMAARGSRIVVGQRFARPLGVPMTVAILSLSLTSLWEFKRLSFGEFDLAVQDGKEGMLESSKLSVMDEQLPAAVGSTRAVVLFVPLTSSYFEEPVYNTTVANIDDAPIIRAHDMGARNVEIIRYYADRQSDRVFYICDIRRPIIDRLGTGPELLAKLQRGESLPTLAPQEPPAKANAK